jgi:hypothetical protein
LKFQVGFRRGKGTARSRVRVLGSWKFARNSPSAIM